MTDIYFSLKPGYEELAAEMVAYADENMSVKDGKIQLILFGGQGALMKAAMQARSHNAVLELLIALIVLFSSICPNTAVLYVTSEIPSIKTKITKISKIPGFNLDIFNLHTLLNLLFL